MNILLKIEQLLLGLSEMMLGITIVMFIILFPSENYGKLNVERIAPDKNSTVFIGGDLVFKIKATDSDGLLAYSEWFITGKRQTRHIVTGYSSMDSWSHTFENEGVYFVNVFVYDINKKSEIVVWKVTVKRNITVPIVENTYPTDTYVEIDVNQSIEFKLDVKDDACELARIDWFIEEKLNNSFLISGCEYNENWSHRFDYSGYYSVCARVYNKVGNYESRCWSVYVKENIASNQTDEAANNDNTYISESNKKVKYSFIGISYSNRTMSDGGLASLMDSNPTAIEIQIKYGKDILASRITTWFLNGEFGFGLGSFAQSGLKVEFLLNLPVATDNFGMSFYFGGGGVYQRSEINRTNDTDATNDGYGGSYVGGIEVILGNVLGLFLEYNGIATTSGKLDVGSSGLAFGAGIWF